MVQIVQIGAIQIVQIVQIQVDQVGLKCNMNLRMEHPDCPDCPDHTPSVSSIMVASCDAEGGIVSGLLLLHPRGHGLTSRARARAEYARLPILYPSV